MDLSTQISQPNSHQVTQETEPKVQAYSLQQLAGKKKGTTQWFLSQKEAPQKSVDVDPSRDPCMAR